MRRRRSPSDTVETTEMVNTLKAMLLDLLARHLLRHRIESEGEGDDRHAAPNQ